jgi:hypothetical protein
MKNLKSLIVQFAKIFLLAAYLFGAVSAGAFTDLNTDKSKVRICFPFSPAQIKGLLSFQSQSLTTFERNLILEFVFESFQDSKSPLYDILIDLVIPFLYSSEEIVEKYIQANSLEWQDFKVFLVFYKPGSERYNELPADLQQQLIDSAYEAFKNYL